MLVKSILFVSGAILASIVGQVRLNTANTAHKLEIASISAEYQAMAIDSAEIVRQHQLEITSTYEKALNEATKENATLRANASKSRTELNSLRAQAAEAARRISLPDTAPAAVIGYGIVASELLAECSREYQKLGEAADGHQADVRMILKAWPKLNP